MFERQNSPLGSLVREPFDLLEWNKTLLRLWTSQNTAKQLKEVKDDWSAKQCILSFLICSSKFKVPCLSSFSSANLPMFCSSLLIFLRLFSSWTIWASSILCSGGSALDHGTILNCALSFFALMSRIRIEALAYCYVVKGLTEGTWTKVVFFFDCLDIRLDLKNSSKWPRCCLPWAPRSSKVSGSSGKVVSHCGGCSAVILIIHSFFKMLSCFFFWVVLETNTLVEHIVWRDTFFLRLFEDCFTKSATTKRLCLFFLFSQTSFRLLSNKKKRKKRKVSDWRGRRSFNESVWRGTSVAHLVEQCVTDCLEVVFTFSFFSLNKCSKHQENKTTLFKKPFSVFFFISKTKRNKKDEKREKEEELVSQFWFELFLWSASKWMSWEEELNRLLTMHQQAEPSRTNEKAETRCHSARKRSRTVLFRKHQRTITKRFAKRQ